MTISTKTIAKIPSLLMVKLDVNDQINYSHPLPGVNFDEIFAVVGEVADTRYFLFYRWFATGGNTTGFLPGMLDLKRFVNANEDDY